MTRIAIEATGCDKGLNEVIKGAQMAFDKDQRLELILVAGKDKLPKHYEHFNRLSFKLTEHTYIPKDNSRQRESSIYKAIEMHKKGEVDAVIAPGDTGATVFYATGLLKRIKGLIRPSIAANFPHNNVLLDVGASYESKAQHLFQFAIMGNVYSHLYLGVENPLIGLINLGEESHKGPDFIKETNELIKKLEKKGYNISEKYFEPSFFGIENFDKGLVGVVDGFAGNLILKSFETALTTYAKILKREIKSQCLIRQCFAWLGVHNPVEKLKKEFDYKEYAACPLLGVNGNVMISHGKSDAETIANSIKATKKYLECEVNKKLKEEILRYGKL